MDKEKEVEYKLVEQNVEEMESVHLQRVSLQSRASTMSTECSISSKRTAEKENKNEKEDEPEDLRIKRREFVKALHTVFDQIFVLKWKGLLLNAASLPSTKYF